MNDGYRVIPHDARCPRCHSDCVAMQRPSPTWQVHECGACGLTWDIAARDIETIKKLLTPEHRRDIIRATYTYAGNTRKGARR